MPASSFGLACRDSDTSYGQGARQIRPTNTRLIGRNLPPRPCQTPRRRYAKVSLSDRARSKLGLGHFCLDLCHKEGSICSATLSKAMNGIQPFLLGTFRSTNRYDIEYALEVKKMLKDNTDEKTEEQNNDKKITSPKTGAEALATFNLGSTRFTW